LSRQILAGHEIARRTGLGIPMRAARGIENGFVQPLAAFAGDAGIAEAACTRKDAEFVVGFIDNDRLDGRQCRHVAIERVGAVGMTSPQFASTRDVQANDGTPYLLASGPALAAGSTMQLQLANLPVHSRIPVYVGLGLAAAVVAFGVWLAVGARGKSKDQQFRQRLAERRDSLLGELAGLEARRAADGLDVKGTARRQRLLNELEEIYGELDEEHSAA